VCVSVCVCERVCVAFCEPMPTVRFVEFQSERCSFAIFIPMIVPFHAGGIR